MAKYFDPKLINGPSGDPGLYVCRVFERRALLFDLGELTAVAPRKLLRIEHVFISHRHMDHFIGFDHLLRCLLGREKKLHVWGPSGMIAAKFHGTGRMITSAKAANVSKLIERIPRQKVPRAMRPSDDQ